MMQVLSFRDVCFRFEDQRVVDGVSFDVAPGEIVCLLGPSGCGKTTSLRLAGGMETPDSGEVLISGETVSSPTHVVPPEKRNIGFLFQDYALFPHLSVLENICFGIRHLAEKERLALARNLLAQVTMTDFEDSFPHTLSGGEQQRAALARALAPEPALLLMDEPFSSLDQQLRDQMRDLTIKMLRSTGAAGLIVTHDAADALRMADRVAVQRAGQLVQIGTPKNIYAAPVEIGVAHMFGQVNTLSAGELGSDVLAPVGGAPACAWSANDMIGVRPVDIARAASGPAYAVSARLVAQRHVGTGWLCDYELQSGALWQAELREPATWEGDNFFVPADRLMVFKQSER
ncbi:MAG: ABC transporter ATP-binding protein [Pseudomonadota bacterium]|nr:ABC transporter ATP-binding protein [Pseudomonadota bacterium]